MRRVIWPLTVMTAIQVIATMTFLAVPVLAPAIARDIGIDASRIGVYSSLVFVGATVASLISGTYIGRYGAIRACQIGLFFAAAALSLTITGILPLVLFSAVAVGFGYGPATPAGSHVLARVTPEGHRGIVFSIKQSGVPLGGVIVGVVLPPIAVAAGWEAAILTTVLMVLALVFMVQFLRARFDDDRRADVPITIDAVWRSVALVLRDADLRRVALACSIFGGAQLCLFAFFVAYLVSDGGLDLVDAGIAFATMQVSGVVARVVWGWLVDHLIPAQLALALIAFGSAGFVLVLSGLRLDWPFGAVLFVAVVLGATTSGWNGIALAEVARLAPSVVALATAGTVVFTYLGVVIGPSTFSAVVALTGGYDGAFYALAMLTAAAGVLLLGRRWRNLNLQD